jgi:hypothetical protein
VLLEVESKKSNKKEFKKVHIVKLSKVKGKSKVEILDELNFRK